MAGIDRAASPVGGGAPGAAIWRNVADRQRFAAVLGDGFYDGHGAPGWADVGRSSRAILPKGDARPISGTVGDRLPRQVETRNNRRICDLTNRAVQPPRHIPRTASVAPPRAEAVSICFWWSSGRGKKPQALAHCGFRVRKLIVYESAPSPGKQS
jgi:hypothetical protein